eukprot:6660181-Prymnesium_polylepis.1
MVRAPRARNLPRERGVAALGTILAVLRNLGSTPRQLVPEHSCTVPSGCTTAFARAAGHPLLNLALPPHYISLRDRSSATVPARSPPP